ncbi:chemotaxis protein CheB [Dyella solisilvae]|uniref:protein-glutamate methylesterase n=1 Tax=Dyella solisilvae TaxID=1920168 RepID=A0A370KCL6_9GAMM|nr:chemotaxis protein CheB [Dyella solisilvae]RDJ00396.1 chemotaxis protein CheB [Dyella solisilvae]
MNSPQAIVIGCSAGGLNALETLFAGLDRALPQPIAVCCHTGSATVDLMCELLGQHATLRVVEARERASLEGGVIHIAPSGYHLLVEASHRFALSVDERVSFARPSIDVLFDSAAEAYRDGLIGVLLTGANRDGAEGVARIRHCGGVAIVQDPADAAVPVMPQAALELAGADHCLPLAAIAPLLNRLCLT